MQVQCRLRFAIWKRSLWVRASQSYPYYMKSKNVFFTITQKVLLWGAWNCNSRLQSLKVSHGQIFIKIWDMRVSSLDWFVVECSSFHGTRGGWYDPPCRFAPDWAKASRKNEHVARCETKRLIYKLKVLGQPVTWGQVKYRKVRKTRDRR